MAFVSVSLKNATSSDIIVHGYDQFAGGQREVPNSPFGLSPNETSPTFPIKVGDGGSGTLGWDIDGGTNDTDISVSDGDVIDVG